jgi:hypothetical protein
VKLVHLVGLIIKKYNEVVCVCVVNAQGVVEVWVHTFLALAQDGGDWSVSFPSRGREELFAPAH